MATESITELASIIATSTAQVSAYLDQNGLPQPSFAVTGPSTSQIPPSEVEIESARLTAIDATQRLRNLLLGPHDFLTSITPSEWISFQAVARFGLASCVPIDGSASCATLAAACGLPESTTRRLLRHAVVKNVFCEAGPDGVAHNAVSRLLAEKPTLNAWLRFNTGDSWSAASQTVEALARWHGSEEPNETGFTLASGTGLGMYDTYAVQPERGERFANSMKNLTESPGFDAGHLVAGYDWASLKSAVVVDLGGSHGAVARRLVESFPTLSVVVQDLAEVIAQAPPSQTHISFMSHDFFTPQPVVADVYLFRWILHNWSDKYCAAADLIMLQLFNSKERDMEDWAALFETADSRFRFQGGRLPTGSRLSVLEAVWEG
ncbi:O-methyltransferase [Neohortaea acidophila]|uniref:O-methyltransferase n=1 Tax=Neohortaea acidophila TaxID=245834 RepID=A0A6A6Q0U5_9PEZI|nr:O-methyltransferase [Neohortaea acidophila]KAF2485885.1 O-methyltransferase [Neohortaea acidophila]